MVAFADVQAVLSKIIGDWTTGNGGPPDLLGAHQTALFAWDTKANLLASKARGLPLIQPEIIGKKNEGATANIVVDLTTGAAPFPAMPFGGLDSQNGKFHKPTDPEIVTMIDWIEAGCPD